MQRRHTDISVYLPVRRPRARIRFRFLTRSTKRICTARIIARFNTVKPFHFVKTILLSFEIHTSILLIIRFANSIYSVYKKPQRLRRGSISGSFSFSLGRTASFLTSAIFPKTKRHTPHCLGKEQKNVFIKDILYYMRRSEKEMHIFLIISLRL